MPEKVNFNNQINAGFSQEVKAEVRAFFKEKNLSKHANGEMILKTIMIVSLYLFSYLLILYGSLSLTAMWLLCIAMGIGLAGIGFSVAHDALHGSYSSKGFVNDVIGFSFDMVGANGYIWKITHNVIHHTYTNIQGHDEDLEVADFIRLSPHTPFKPIHKLQHILALPAYSFATIFWVFVKDYWYFFKPTLGPFENKKHKTQEWVKLIVAKLFYYGYAIVIPLVVLEITWWQFLIGFLTVHLTAGIILGVVFQLAHVVEETTHPVPDDTNTIDDHWVIHEMHTTNNFARSNKLLSWYIGGLNYQIEHHLFPNICSVHYPQISPIVEKVAKKHGIPYNCHDTFRQAVSSHFKTLKKFGNPDYVYSPA